MYACGFQHTLYLGFERVSERLWFPDNCFSLDFAVAAYGSSLLAVVDVGFLWTV